MLFACKLWTKSKRIIILNIKYKYTDLIDLLLIQNNKNFIFK